MQDLLEWMEYLEDGRQRDSPSPPLDFSGGPGYNKDTRRCPREQAPPRGGNPTVATQHMTHKAERLALSA